MASVQTAAFKASELKKVGRAPRCEKCDRWMAPINDPIHKGDFICPDGCQAVTVH